MFRDTRTYISIKRYNRCFFFVQNIYLQWVSRMDTISKSANIYTIYSYNRYRDSITPIFYSFFK